jgi:hypothetical protein
MPKDVDPIQLKLAGYVLTLEKLCGVKDKYIHV